MLAYVALSPSVALLSLKPLVPLHYSYQYQSPRSSDLASSPLLPFFLSVVDIFPHTHLLKQRQGHQLSRFSYTDTRQEGTIQGSFERFDSSNRHVLPLAVNIPSVLRRSSVTRSCPRVSIHGCYTSTRRSLTPLQSFSHPRPQHRSRRLSDSPRVSPNRTTRPRWRTASTHTKALTKSEKYKADAKDEKR